MRRQRTFATIVLVIGWLFSVSPAWEARPAAACTTAVVSGRATADGRPLLWKNRDAPERHNEVIYLDDGPFRCVAVANAGQRKSVWMGVNEAGLCIENSLSKDLVGKPGAKGDGNGAFILRALQNCATVGDVELLLRETAETGRSTNGNFGVIDACGGAVLFEVSPSSHATFDANDPAVAPKGYIVRSNFALTARKLDGEPPPERLATIYSSERYLRGCRLLDCAVTGRGLDVRYLLRHCTRDLSDQRGNPLPGTINGPAARLPEVIDTAATISRRTTVSAAVFQGVRPGEDPALTTMWVLLGDPSYSIAVPCWVAAGGVAAELDGPKRSDLCDITVALRNAHYTWLGVVRTERLPGIWSLTWPAEDTILEKTERQLELWRASPDGPTDAAAFHQTICREAMTSLQELVSRGLAVPAPDRDDPAVAETSP